MSLRHKQHFPTPGAPPATLLRQVTADAQPPVFAVAEYGPGFYEEKAYARVEEIPERAAGDHLRWVEMNGLSDTAALDAFGKKFKLHPLALEDTLHTGQRAK